MAPTDAKAASKVADRRQQLLETAASLFVENGYSATGVDDIGEAVGITGPALYRHFPNKQAILDAVVLEGMERLLASVRTAVSDHTVPPEQALRRLVEARVDYAFQEAFTLPLHDHEAQHISDPVRRQIDALEEFYIAEWMRVLVQVRPTLPAAELQTALIASHVLIGYTAVRMYARGTESLREHLVRMALAALAA